MIGTIIIDREFNVKSYSGWNKKPVKAFSVLKNVPL
jgi:hypothetical protein